MRRRKIRKFADRQTIKQSKNSSKTEATLILCGYSGERANNRGDSTTERRMRRRKMRKFTIFLILIKIVNKKIRKLSTHIGPLPRVSTED